MVFRKHLIFIAPILLVASFAAYFNWTKEKPKTKVHDEKMYYQGKIFREELVKRWRGQPNKFLSDFSEFCTPQFVGLTLIQAQDKMLGAGQKFEFIEAKSVPMDMPPNTFAVAGGFSLHSSLISSAGANFLLYVDTPGNWAKKKVRKVECVIRNVDL